MKLSQAREKGIFKTTLYIGQFLGVEEKDVWLEMREPSAEETTQFKEGDPATSLKALKGVLVNCIIDHNFESEDGTKASKKEVFEFLLESSALFSYVVKEWQKAIPLTRKRSEK